MALAATLVTVILTETAFAYKPQANLWEERGNRPPIQLASATTQLKHLLSTLPAAALPKVAPSSAVSALALPASFLSNVNVKRTLGSDPANAVILLEDVHHNIEAQKHLSLALQALADQPGATPVSVSLEGATGSFLFSSFHRFPDASIASSVADAFLASGDIGGPSHAGFVSRPAAGHRGLSFTGADDTANYRRNVAAYRDSGVIRAKTRAAVAGLRQDLSRRASREFSPKLAAFNAAVERHHTGELSLADHARTLASLTEASFAVRRFVEAHAMESRLDLARVDVERRRVIEKLVAKLSPSEIAGLVSLSLGYRDGTVSFGGYYQALRKLCARAGIDLRTTPAFDDYVRYVLLADGIDADALFAAMETMEQSAYARLASSDDERRLVAEVRRSRLAERLVEFGLTSQQWDAYKTQQPLVHGIDLSTFVAFYEAAEARDHAMASAISARGPAVLVAGGFHSDGVVAQLRNSGRTIIVCAPKISKADPASASAYLSVFDRERAPLERIFAGEKLFLASLPAGASGRLVEGTDATSELAHVTEVLTLASAPNQAAAASARLAASQLGDSAAPVSVDRDGDRTTVISRSVSGSLATVVSPVVSGVARKPFWTQVRNRIIESRNVTVFTRPDFRSRRVKLMTFLVAIALIPAGLALLIYAHLAQVDSSVVAAAFQAEDTHDPSSLRGDGPPNHDDSLKKPDGTTVHPGGLFGAAVALFSAGGSSSDTPDRAHSLSELQTGERGMRAWLENATKEMAAPGANIVELALDLSGQRGPEARNAALPLLKTGTLSSMGARGLRGVSITVRSLAADIKGGAYDAEIASLAAQGIRDPNEVFRRLQVALAAVAQAALRTHSLTAQVVIETDMEAAFREGGEPALAAEIDALSKTGGAMPRVASYLFGRNGYERRGAIDRLVYKSVLEKGTVPQIALDFGPHTYVLTVKAFVYAVRDRCSDLLEKGATVEQLRAEVWRLGQSLNAISVDEIDREPEIGVDSLIDRAIEIISRDEQTLLGAARVVPPELAAQLSQQDSALRERVANLQMLKGKAGLATAKLVHQIYLHIFHGKPLPERELEAVYGDWLTADIHDARGAVRQIQQNTGASLVQGFMVAAPAEASNGGASIRSAGLAGGWVEGQRAQTHSYTAEELAEFETFLQQAGLARQETISEALPMSASDPSVYARVLAGLEFTPVRAPSSDVLARVNREVIDFLAARNELPSEIIAAAHDHSRGTVTINDLVEALQQRVAGRMADERKAVVTAVATRLATTSPGDSNAPAANRSLANRVALALPFVLGQAVILIAALIFDVHVGRILLIGFFLIANIFPAILLYQGAAIALAIRRVNRGAEGGRLIPQAAAFINGMLPTGTVGTVINDDSHPNGEIYLDHFVLDQMSPASQRSVIREELRHLRYQRRRWYLNTQATRFSRFVEEFVVNVVYPIVELSHPDPDVVRLAVLDSGTRWDDLTFDLGAVAAEQVRMMIRNRWNRRREQGTIDAPNQSDNAIREDFFHPMPFDPGNQPDALEKINLDPRPTGEPWSLTHPVFADKILPNQTLFTMVINGRAYWVLADKVPTLRYECLLIPKDRDQHLRMNVEETNLDVLAFHRKTGLRGFINSWGVGGLPRFHDHVYFETLPIDRLETSVEGIIDGSIRVGQLKGYAGTTTVFESDDDAALARRMTEQAEYLMNKGIPHIVYVSAGRVIFIWRNNVARDVWAVRNEQLEGRSLTSLSFGGLLNYPASVLTKQTAETAHAWIRRLSWPQEDRNAYVAGLLKIARVGQSARSRRNRAPFFGLGMPLVDDPRDALQLRPSDALLSPSFDKTSALADGTVVIRFPAIASVHQPAALAVTRLGDDIRLADVLSADNFRRMMIEAGLTLETDSSRASYAWAFHDAGGEVSGEASLTLEQGIWTITVKTSIPQLTDDLAGFLRRSLIMSGMIDSSLDEGSPRSFRNRIWLALSFVTPAVLLTLGLLATGQDVSGTLWLPALITLGIWALGAIPFLWQAYWVRRASYPATRWRGLVRELAMARHRNLGAGVAALTSLGFITINRGLVGRLPHSQQLSLMREEERHLRYRMRRGTRSSSALGRAREEWYVNALMPVFDLFNRNIRNGVRVIPVDFIPTEPRAVDVHNVPPGANGHDFRSGPYDDINLNADIVGALGLTLLGMGVSFGLVLFVGSIVGWTGYALYRRLAPSWMARRWLSEGRGYASAVQNRAPTTALVDALDAAAPKGILFGARSSDDFRNAALSGFAAQAAHETTGSRRLLQWGSLAGYRRSVAVNGGSSVEARLDQAERAGAKTRVITYHVNQLGSEGVIASELKELQAVVDRAARERAAGERVAVVAAVSPGLSAAHAAALAGIIASARGAAVSINVTDDLRAADGEAYSYEKLLAKAAAGSGLEALEALVNGNYDSAAFLTFSKIPSQFLADGRLRAIWILLANIGAGWAPMPVDTLIRAAILAEQSA